MLSHLSRNHKCSKQLFTNRSVQFYFHSSSSLLHLRQGQDQTTRLQKPACLSPVYIVYVFYHTHTLCQQHDWFFLGTHLESITQLRQNNTHSHTVKSTSHQFKILSLGPKHWGHTPCRKRVNISRFNGTETMVCMGIKAGDVSIRRAGSTDV